MIIKTIFMYIVYRLPVLSLLLWGYAYLWLITDERYMAFLNPKFIVVLVPAFLLNTVFMFSCLINHKKININLNNIISVLISLVPLCYLFFIYGQTPESSLIDKKTVYSQSVVTQSDKKETRDLDNTAINTNINKPINTANNNSSAVLQNVSILELIKNPDKYKDKPVAIEGAVLEEEYMPKGYMFVFRYVIVCCAADARPMGVFIKTDTQKEFKPESWVRVSGVFKVIQIDGQPVASIEKKSITQIKTPPAKQTYLTLF